MRTSLNLATVALILLPASVAANDFSYTYIEAIADASKTRNTADAPVEKDADGNLLGFEASWEIAGAFYVKGAWSRETKDFANEVARTALELDSEQVVTSLGAGYHIERGERTSFYLEAAAILELEVDHSVPHVTPSRFGPPVVTTQDSTIDGDGYSATLGIRRAVGSRWEMDSALSRLHTSGDVLRTGDTLSDSETLLRIGGRFYATDGLSLGAFVSYSRHTDDNFDDIRKLGATLRYSF